MSVTLKNTLLKNTLIRPAVPMDSIRGNILWLDSTDASTITLNGSNVSQWNDKSGYGNNVQQTTASKQPLYTTYNGKPAIQFGGDDYFTTVSNFPALTSYTIFVACRYNAVGAGSDTLGLYSFGTPPSNRVIMSKPNDQSYLRIDHPPTSASYTDKTITTSPLVQTAKWTGSQTRLYINGSLSTTILGSSNALFSDIGAVGAYNNSGLLPLQGHIFEFIVYGRELNDSDRGAIETYLTNKWGI
jgi:hypothetical protein